MSEAQNIRAAFFQRLDKPVLTEKLFDQVPDIAFFIKDHLGRYVAANKTLVARSGVENKEALIGKTADQLFPEPLGAAFAEQDRQVLKTALRISGQLELHLHPNGEQGWCITYKEPIFDNNHLITRARVEAACHKLTATGKSIVTIAMECGYSDQSAFTRQFKQTTGLTPKAYRDSQAG